MSNEPDDLAARLAALEGASGKKAGGRRPSPVTALLGVLGIAGLGGLAYAALQPEASAPMPTAAPAEFQDKGTGFGDIVPVSLPIRTPPPPIPDDSASETERLLRESIEALRAELDALRADAAKDTGGADEATITDLSNKLIALQDASVKAQRDLERRLADAGVELEKMRMDLELARLEQPVPKALGPSEDELRLAALERRRAAEAEARAERIASPMIAYSGSGAGLPPSNGAEARLSDDEAFVRSGAGLAEVTRADVIANPSHTVPQGTLIQAVTETALDSSLPGSIRAIVSEDVHAFDGSRVLIPRGSRLIGRYRSDVALAQSRVMVAWDRIILPDNQSVQISAYGGEELGRSGTTGFVDTRFAERFGSAALISLIGALPAAAAGQIEDEAAADVASDVGSDLRDSTQSVMQDYLAIKPVIHVDQGTRITVMVDRDLEIF